MTPAKLIFLMFAAAVLPPIALAPATAQTQQATVMNPPAPPRPPAPAKPLLEKPYKPVAVTVAAATDDPNFTSFQQQLAAAAKNRVYAELARLMVPQGFFWDGDFDNRFDPKRSAAENFATAIGLEREGGMGWTILASFAAAPDAAPLAAHPGIVCAPAPPGFDDVAFDQLLDATQTGAADWLYPRSAGTPMRLAPRPASRAVETLGMHLVRLLGTDNAWAHVAAPSGRTGFVAPGTLSPLRSDRLCYEKDITGRWAIAGYIAVAN